MSKRSEFERELSCQLEIEVRRPDDSIGYCTDCFRDGAEWGRRFTQAEERRKVEGLVEALKEIAKTTYGTEWISHDLEEYKSNHEIICRHYFGAQSVAREALAAYKGET